MAGLTLLPIFAAFIISTYICEHPDRRQRIKPQLAPCCMPLPLHAAHAVTGIYLHSNIWYRYGGPRRCE